jgi:hypothetical protein
MSFDIERARRETPGCEGVVHFNNAGAALMPRRVVDAIVGHLQREATIGGYEAAEEAEPQVTHTYDAIAQLLNCGADEIAIIENATRAWDMAFYALPFGPGDRILASAAEYESNYLAFLQVGRKTGARVEVVPSDSSGQVAVDALESMIDDRVKLIPSRTSRRTAGSSTRRRQSEPLPGDMAFHFCSMPVSRPASCPSTWSRLAATFFRPPVASICAVRAAPDSSTFVDRSSTALNRRSSISAPRSGHRATPTR